MVKIQKTDLEQKEKFGAKRLNANRFYNSKGS